MKMHVKNVYFPFLFAKWWYENAYNFIFHFFIFLKYTNDCIKFYFFIFFFWVWESIGEYIKTIFFWFFKWDYIDECIKNLSYFSCMNRNLWECIQFFSYFFKFFYFLLLFFRHEIFKKMYLEMHEISLLFFLRRYEIFF